MLFDGVFFSIFFELFDFLSRTVLADLKERSDWREASLNSAFPRSFSALFVCFCACSDIANNNCSYMHRLLREAIGVLLRGEGDSNFGLAGLALALLSFQKQRVQTFSLLLNLEVLSIIYLRRWEILRFFVPYASALLNNGLLHLQDTLAGPGGSTCMACLAGEYSAVSTSACAACAACACAHRPSPGLELRQLEPQRLWRRTRRIR